jgi:hypothetical protein
VVDPAKEGRPLVYAEGTTVHVGDKTVEARDPVAFIKATDDGAVYEAALDGTLWFTDGVTTSVIGTSGCTACPTEHAGVVSTGASGSLVVWGDVSDPGKLPVEYVVFDTSRLEEVGRIALTEPRSFDIQVVYVDEDRVWFTDNTSPGCWVLSLSPCKDPHLLRYDVTTGKTANVSLAELDAEMTRRSRMFVAQDDDLENNEPGFSNGADFHQVGMRLLASPRTNGDAVRLQLPVGFAVIGRQIDEHSISLSQWLDDDHIVVWAAEGGGDLPAKRGDLLVCPLPDGTCRVAVPRSSRPYVAP